MYRTDIMPPELAWLVNPSLSYSLALENDAPTHKLCPEDSIFYTQHIKVSNRKVTSVSLCKCKYVWVVGGPSQVPLTLHFLTDNFTIPYTYLTI